MTISSIDTSSLSSFATGLRRKLFQQIDANSDGQITQSELETALKKVGGSTSDADS
ncbi:EF-hand domain-containing protein, partial [Acinetobacter baumannii]